MPQHFQFSLSVLCCVSTGMAGLAPPCRPVGFLVSQCRKKLKVTPKPPRGCPTHPALLARPLGIKPPILLPGGQRCCAFSKGRTDPGSAPSAANKVGQGWTGMSWDKEPLLTPAVGGCREILRMWNSLECWQWWMGLVGSEDTLVGEWSWVIPGAGRGRLAAVGWDLSPSGTGELADCPHLLCSLLWAMPTMTHCHTPGLCKDLHVFSSTPNPK